MSTERRDGHSKLVYDKATRTINAVDPHPVGVEKDVAVKALPPAEAALRAYAEASKGVPCPICARTESCDHTVRERLFADLDKRSSPVRATLRHAH